MVANQHATMTAGLDTDLWTKVLVLIDLTCLSWMECRSCAVWDQIWSWFVQTGLQLPYVPTQEIWQEIWTGSCVRQLWWWEPTMAPRASRAGTPTWPTCNHPPQKQTILYLHIYGCLCVVSVYFHILIMFMNYQVSVSCGAHPQCFESDPEQKQSWIYTACHIWESIPEGMRPVQHALSERLP